MRYFLAFLAFNLFGYLFVWAYGLNTIFLFDHELVIELFEGNYKPEDSNWIWGEHYIYRLYVCCLIIFICSFFAGAVAQKMARMSQLFQIFQHPLLVPLYLFGFTDYLNVEINNQNTLFVIICIVTIPLSTYIAFYSGYLGEVFQIEEFGTDNVLGINGYHWVWGIIPVHLYSIMMAYSSTHFK